MERGVKEGLSFLMAVVQPTKTKSDQCYISGKKNDHVPCHTRRFIIDIFVETMRQFKQVIGACIIVILKLAYIQLITL